MQMMTFEQFFNGSMNVRPEPGGLLAAPSRGPLKEGGLLRRVVIPIGLALARAATQVGLGQLRTSVETHDARPEPNIQRLADVAPGDRIQTALDLYVAIACHLGFGPRHDLEGCGGQCQHGRLLDRLKHQQRLGARGTVAPLASDSETPAFGCGVDRFQTAEGAARPEALADERHLAFDAGFVLGLRGSRWVDQTPKVVRQLGVATIEHRIVQVRMQDAALEVIEDDACRNGVEERKRALMADEPGRRIHPSHDRYEHMP